jgi:putative methyltransferase
MKRRVYLAQINHDYGGQHFLPYSVGRLWAYAMAQPDIAEAYELGGYLYRRENISTAIARIDEPDVFGASLYVWNRRYTLALCEEVKARWPDCLIVLGGPEVPKDPEDLIAEHWFINTVVLGEGEEQFAGTLRDWKNGGWWRPQRVAERIEALDQLPSPYLAGTFDTLMEEPIEWHATQETHRGCPFSCTFCDWGSAVFARVRRFPLKTIKAEIEWFGRHSIDLLYNADANFGMMREDVEQVAALVETKAMYGFPRKIRAAWAKKHNPRLRQIAIDLERAGMQKGVTLALQSMNDDVLEAVKRRNIKIDDLAELSTWYRDNGIPTYVELILGLPGETYDSWADGFSKLLDASPHQGINVYVCMKLENSELNAPEYIAEYGIKTVTMPMLLNHGSTGASDPHQETYEVLIETATMPHADWRQAFVFSWAIQTFHCMGLLQLAAIEAQQCGTSYRSFYENVIAIGRARPWTMLGMELRWLDGVLERVVHGRPWDTVLPGAGDVMWPPEEATFLRIVPQLDRFYDELAEAGVEIPDTQMAAVVRPQAWGSFADYAREIVWYGRKSGRTLRAPLSEAA